MHMNDYIRTYENNLSSDFCERLIEKFELDPNQEKGVVGEGYRPDLKQSTDICISQLDNWKEEDEYLFNSLKDPIFSYLDELYMKSSNGFLSDPFDTGYQIQRTTPDQIGYTWHNDFSMGNDGRCHVRIATYIWYLNTIEDGGETEFIDGTIIKPKQGDLVLFPATWVFAHKGNPPKTTNKYICTGWYNTYY